MDRTLRIQSQPNRCHPTLPERISRTLDAPLEHLRKEKENEMKMKMKQKKKKKKKEKKEREKGERGKEKGEWGIGNTMGKSAGCY